MTKITDKKRIEWLIRNMSKLGITPDYRWYVIKDKNISYVDSSEFKEYTDIRKKIDEEILKEEKEQAN